MKTRGIPVLAIRAALAWHDVAVPFFVAPRLEKQLMTTTNP